MASSSDLLVIGGGVIGLTTAYWAMKAGARVTLLERGETGREASWAGAGIVPPGNPARIASPYESLRAFSSARFAEFSQQLRDETGIDNGYRRCGGIEWLEAHDEELIAGWTAEGIAFERLSSCALDYLEPAIGNPPGVPYHLPGMAQVRNPWHLRAVRTGCERLGVRIITQAEVVRFQTRDDQIDSVELSTGERHTAGELLVCAGAWSDGLLAPLGVRLGLHPVRGQIVLYRAESPIFHRVLLHGKRYLVPREDGRILVGSTEEPEAGFTKANTDTGIAELRRFAEHLVPELARTPIETSWAGLRPGSPDGLPLLGRLPGWRNLSVAAGHFRAGIQLSIATGIVLSEMLLGQALSLPLELFRPDRAPVKFRAAFRS